MRIAKAAGFQSRRSLACLNRVMMADAPNGPKARALVNARNFIENRVLGCISASRKPT
jgi:hypothetical protein